MTGEPRLAAAAEVDRKIAAGQGKDLPLAGVPLAIKRDSFWTKGIRTTGGTKVFADFVPNEDATVVARLTAAGFSACWWASRPCTENGVTASPKSESALWRLPQPLGHDAHPGREQSGGNAVALASGNGSRGRRRRHRRDRTGSRQPLCGVVGVKVTYGCVSRYGSIPLSWSMDTVGPMSRSVGGDAGAGLCEVMAGHDQKDPTTLPRPSSRLSESASLRLESGDSIGVPHDGKFLAAMEPDVAAAIQDAPRRLLGKQSAAALIDVRFPLLEPRHRKRATAPSSSPARRPLTKS